MVAVERITLSLAQLHRQIAIQDLVRQHRHQAKPNRHTIPVAPVRRPLVALVHQVTAIQDQPHPLRAVVLPVVVVHLPAPVRDVQPIHPGQHQHLEQNRQEVVQVQPAPPPAPVAVALVQSRVPQRAGQVAEDKLYLSKNIIVCKKYRLFFSYHFLYTFAIPISLSNSTLKCIQRTYQHLLIGLIKYIGYILYLSLRLSSTSRYSLLPPVLYIGIIKPTAVHSLC